MGSSILMDEAVRRYRVSLIGSLITFSAPAATLTAAVPEYEWRWKCKKEWSPPPFRQPRWDGSPLQGRTILLHTEQGLGDTLHFIRYAPLVKQQGGTVWVQCQKTLLPL